MKKKVYLDKSKQVYKSLPNTFYYSKSSNCIISLSQDQNIEVLDIHTGEIALNAYLTDGQDKRETDSISGFCNYIADEEKLIVVSGRTIGCRSTSGEQFFLKTILQNTTIPENGKVTIELSIVKTGLLLSGLEQCLKTVDTSTTICSAHKLNFKEVYVNLKNVYEQFIGKIEDISGSNLKWMTLCLTMEHSLLMDVFNTAFLLTKHDNRGPALPVIGDMLQRLTCMQTLSSESTCSEKRLMFSEVDRLLTFSSWPHMNYKWAFPGPMAEAGFYHPSTNTKTAEDRAMCFTCNACLVLWESTDQPWSEHKRHSPNCPFVKGEHTENVPIQVYAATACARKMSRSTDKIVCLSSTSIDSMVAVGTEDGYIIIWETYPILRMHSEYQISVSSSCSSQSKSKESKNITIESKTDPSQQKVTVNEFLHSTANMKPPSNENGSLVVVEGEVYFVIPDPPDSSAGEKDPVESPTKGKAKVTDQGMKEEHDEEVKDDVSKTETVHSPLNVKSEKKNVSPGLKIEKSCVISSVVMMKDKEYESRLIIAGVKIVSSRSKGKEKHKLFLLVYKIANKPSSINKPEVPSIDIDNPFNNPFSVMPGASLLEDELGSWFGSDEDYGLLDDAKPLSVIDEYLLATGKKHTASNAGTQNIAIDGNKFKKGFVQEEVVKVEDIKTVYEDCAFHKFEIPKGYYTPHSFISKLMVEDGFLIVLIQETHNTTQSNLLVMNVTTNESKSIKVQELHKKALTVSVNDLITICCSKLPSDILCTLSESNNLEEMSSIVVMALSDASLLFLSIPHLIILPLNMEGSSGMHIHKMAYCTSSSSLAVCDINGEFALCSWKIHRPSEVSSNKGSAYMNQWGKAFSSDELDMLCELTSYEPVLEGCYVFFPVNWCVSRMDAVKKTHNSDPMPDHLIKLSPVEMDKRLIEQAEQLNAEAINFTFQVFVTVQSAVGYFDVVVTLKLPVTNDFTCGFYASDSKTERLLYTRAFSDVMNEDKKSGTFTIAIPEFVQHQSMNVVVKFENEENVSISSILENVYVGVYMFTPCPSTSFSYPGCRYVMLTNYAFQENLLDQFLSLIQSHSSLAEGGDAKKILQLLTWIVCMSINATLQLPLVEIMSCKLRPFLRACMLYGDRSMCHRCCQIIFGLLRCSAGDSFISVLTEELWCFLPHVHEAFSSAAIYWSFMLLLKVMDQSTEQSIVTKLKAMLMHVSSFYYEHFNRNDIDGNLLDVALYPTLLEIPALHLPGGTAITVGNHNPLDVLKVPTVHMPGLLETQPLHFVCLTTSEGSKVEVIKYCNKAAKKNTECSVGENELTFSDILPEEIVGLVTEEVHSDKKPAKNHESTKHADAVKDTLVMPVTKWLIVDKMHLSSWHYVILDFHSTVMLTDFVFAPCKCLSSISVYCWQNGQHDNPQLIAHSKEINKKALVLANLTPPVQLQFVKILVIGAVSSSVIIPLGQFYGYVKKDFEYPSLTLINYKEKYEELSCRYLTTIAHVKMSFEHFPCGGNVLKKETCELISELQTNLNILRNNILWMSSEMLLKSRNLYEELPASYDGKSFSCTESVIVQLLQSTLQCFPSKTETLYLSREEFVILFERICVYGTSKVTNLATSFLCKLCSSTHWWSEAVTDIFSRFFCANTDAFPKARLFSLIMRLIHSTAETMDILERFLRLIEIKIHSILKNETSCKTIDWLLLATCEILRCKHGDEMWSFFNPWEYLPTPSPKAQEVVCKPEDASKWMQELLLVEEEVLPQKSTSSDKAVHVECIVNEDESGHNQYYLQQTVFLQRSSSVLKILIEFLCKGISSMNLEQITLVCKVCSLVVINSSSMVYLNDIMTPSQLQSLLRYTICSESWTRLALNNLIESFIHQKSLQKSPFVNREAKKGAKESSDISPANLRVKEMMDAVNKRICEMAEGKTLTAAPVEPEDCAEFIPVKQVLIDSVYCLLETDISKLQDDITNNLSLGPTPEKAKQKKVISDQGLFLSDLKKMQSATLTFLINGLFACDEFESRKRILFHQELLCFMKIMIDNKIKPPANVLEQLEGFFFSFISNTYPIEQQPMLKQMLCYLSIFNPDIVFLEKLLYIQPRTKSNTAFTFLALEKLSLKDFKSATETSIVVELFDSLNKSDEIEGISQLCRKFEKLMSNAKFLQHLDDSQSTQLVTTLSSLSFNFIEKNHVFLGHSCNFRREKVVFLCHECRVVEFMGKADQERSITDCQKMIDLIATVVSKKRAPNDENSFHLVFKNLLEVLRLTGSFAHSKRVTTLAVLANVNKEAYSDLVHPIAMSAMKVLTAMATTSSWTVSSLVSYLRDQNRLEEWNCYNLILFMKLLFSQNKQFFELFVQQDGLSVISDSVIHACADDVQENMAHSSALHDLYTKDIEKCLKIYPSCTRADKLDNFAPLAQISAPGADVLLVDKSPFRRSRFAAWAHHFPEGSDPWLHLDIKLPFEIKLMEIVVHMHNAYLTGAPYKIWVQYKDAGNYNVTVTPILRPGVLFSIVMHFPAGIVCKEIRLNLSRPHSSDHIKLNLIEMFGKCIFTSDSRNVALKKSWRGESWINLLQLVLHKAKISTGLKAELLKLIPPLVAVWPMLSRLSLHLLSNVFVSKLSSAVDDFAYFVIYHATMRLLDTKFLHQLTSAQPQLYIQLLADLFMKSTQQKKIVTLLFNWFAQLLVLVEGDGSANIILNHVDSLLFSNIGNCTVNSNEQLEKVIDRYVQKGQQFVHFPNFLRAFIRVDTSPFKRYQSSAIQRLDLLTHHNDESFENSFKLMMFLYDRRDTTFCNRFSTYLVDLFSTWNSVRIKVMCNLIGCLEQSYNECRHAREWLGTVDGRSFWKLMLKCGNEVHMMEGLNAHPLQQKIVSFFQVVLHLNIDNMTHFCTVLIELLKECRKDGSTLNGYLKFLLLQLVISTNVVALNLKSKDYLYIVQKTHRVGMLSTITFAEVEQHLAKKCVVKKEEEAELNERYTEVDDLVVESGKAAAKRRQSHPQEETGSPVPEVTLNFEFFVPLLSDEALPKTMTLSEVLQLLREKDKLEDIPLVEFKIRRGNPGRTASHLAGKQFPTMLEIFAEMDGLSLLASYTPDHAQKPVISLFTKGLRLPGFSNAFLRDQTKAQYLLHLMLGVQQTKFGRDIDSLLNAHHLHIIPLVCLRDLLTSSGTCLTSRMLSEGVVNFVLKLLKSLVSSEGTKKKEHRLKLGTSSIKNEGKYWAKGTGFGTGSTASNWDVEKVMREKMEEEKQIIVIFEVLTELVDRAQEEETLNDVYMALKDSCLVEVLAGYLRNDSVWDISRHIPTYQVCLKLVKSLSSTPTISLLLGEKNLVKLLANMKTCVEGYQRRLKNTTSKKSEESSLVVSKTDDETWIKDLNLLLDEITCTSAHVQTKANEYRAFHSETKDDCAAVDAPSCEAQKSVEDVYLSEMRPLQFDTYEIITEKDDGTLHFNLPFHFASAVRKAANKDVSSASRARRLAQEVATLSTSLPISHSSTVFLRCDEERLDVMKVLITGPSETPYENGCFEFDIHFPLDYPAAPMYVNLRTTGKHTIRFNPNLYNDGKVCLSVLNTWHGRPEERWNSQTSSLLQVLVSIQSLILVSDPYFNEPGYERMRGTAHGRQNSNEYNANIQHANIKWAMVEQLKRPTKCFKEIIRKHFLLKTEAILAQCKRWLSESKLKSHQQETVKKDIEQLKMELSKLAKDSESEVANSPDDDDIVAKDDANFPGLVYM